MITARRIELTDSVVDIIIKMSEGNPGAATVLADMVKTGDMRNIMTLMDLDDMGFRGGAIWVGYKDFAKQDLAKFIEAAKRRDAFMIDMVRAAGYDVKEGGNAPGYHR